MLCAACAVAIIFFLHRGTVFAGVAGNCLFELICLFLKCRKTKSFVCVPKDSKIQFTCKVRMKYLSPTGAKIPNKSAQFSTIRAEAAGQEELLAAVINRPQIVPPSFSFVQEKWPTFEKE